MTWWCSLLIEIARLMCSILYMDRLKTSPYSDLTTGSSADDIQHMFTREFCRLLGLSSESPLYVTYVLMLFNLSLPSLIETTPPGRHLALLTHNFAPVPIHSLTVGTQALPTIIKLASIMKAKKTEWSQGSEMPVRLGVLVDPFHNDLLQPYRPLPCYFFHRYPILQ